MTQTFRPIVVERLRHGAEQLDRPIIDYGTGQDYTPPSRSIDILESLLRRKAITADEKLSGERFYLWFRLAELEQLRAADIARPYIDGAGAIPELSPRNERARKDISKAIRYVGGIGSVHGSCLWHVIGLDQSLRRWCQEQAKTSSGRILHHGGAAGVLVSALERLSRMPWAGPNERR